MGKDRINKRCFTRNTNFGKNPTQIYRFCVDTSIDKQSGGNLAKGGIPKPLCNAKKGSQGYDNITGYVYNLLVVNGVMEHLAYVECDYVQ
jgi:hypothetical protein